jgi:hypothetical protein
MATVILRISASILLLMVPAGRAQMSVKDIRQAAISDARLRPLLSEMALEFTEDSTGDQTAFAIHLDGHLVTLFNRVQGLSLSACFEGEFDPMKANQWNRQHFSTRAYLDEKGCASLGSDVTFGGGSTNQMIQDFVRGFCTEVAVFAKFLASSPAGPDTPPASPANGTRSPDQLLSPIGPTAWSQLGSHARRTPPGPTATRSVPGLLQIDPNVSLKYDPDQWRLRVPHGDGQFAFAHSSGAGYALVISERTPVPLDAVQDVVLANAQSVDPRASVVFRHRRWVNGVAFWFLKIEATVGTIPMVYWGYYYVGEGGTVQVVTYTEKSRLPEYEQDFTDLLNGLTVSREGRDPVTLGTGRSGSERPRK